MHEQQQTDVGKNPVSAAKEARTWAQIARMAEESLAALEAGRMKDARGLLTAIFGIARNADQSRL